MSVPSVSPDVILTVCCLISADSSILMMQENIEIALTHFQVGFARLKASQQVCLSVTYVSYFIFCLNLASCQASFHRLRSSSMTEVTET